MQPGYQRTWATDEQQHEDLESLPLEPSARRVSQQLFRSQSLQVLAKDAADHFATRLSPEQLEVVLQGLEKVREKRGALAAAVQESIYANNILRQIGTARTNEAPEPRLLRVAIGELDRLARNSQATLNIFLESELLRVIFQLIHSEEPLRLNLLGPYIPIEDIELLELLGVDNAHQALALALARAEGDLTPVDESKAFFDAPVFIAKEVEELAAPQTSRKNWFPRKGIFKVIQGTVLGAGNIALAILSPTPPLIMSAIGSVAASIGHFGDAVDEMTKTSDDSSAESTSGGLLLNHVTTAEALSRAQAAQAEWVRTHR